MGITLEERKRLKKAIKKRKLVSDLLEELDIKDREIKELKKRMRSIGFRKE